MSIRSADATIKGYFYQFNKTIEEILSLKKDSETVDIEGIEDIDINSIDGLRAVQCKYYASQTLTNSVIREPIILMLDHYRTVGTSPVENYALFGYFKNETNESTKNYSLNQLKTILTYKEGGIEKKYFEEHGIPDTILQEFLKKFTLSVGKEFDEQRSDCIKLLRQQYKCTDFEAENYFYNNAVRIVFDLAIQKNKVDRTISKKDFINKVDCKRVLFYAWYRKYNSNAQYVALIKKGVKDTNLFSPAKDKLLYLGKGIDFNSATLPLSAFMENLVTKYFQVGATKYTSRPITVVVDIDKASVLSLKKDLISRQIPFNDGHEEIQFTCETFCNDPIINRSLSGVGKITKASFVIRVISKETFDLHHEKFSKTFSVLAISEEDFDYPKLKPAQLLEAKYLSSLTDINSIL